MNRILIVDDERPITDMIKLCLTKHGYFCKTANDGADAADLVEKERFDLVLLDVMLPEIDGYDLIEYIKQFDIPVIFVTAKGSVENKVKGLRLGAEDYIVKPFDLEELLARIEAVLRRCHKTEAELIAGDLIINTESRTVLKGGRAALLSTKEFDLLLYLVRNKNIALYRERIYEQVWGEEYFGNTRTIDLHVGRLKKKLGLEKEIQCVYKIGYKFISEK